MQETKSMTPKVFNIQILKFLKITIAYNIHHDM